MAKIQRLFYNIHIIEGIGHRDSQLLEEVSWWEKLFGIVCYHRPFV